MLMGNRGPWLIMPYNVNGKQSCSKYFLHGKLAAFLNGAEANSALHLLGSLTTHLINICSNFFFFAVADPGGGAMAPPPVPDKEYLLCISWHFLVKNPLDQLNNEF